VTATPAPQPLRSLAFAAEEPVIQSHPLLDGVPVPRFAETDRWRFDAIRRPANIAPCGWVVVYNGFDAAWNLRVREIIMSMLNPRHPALEARGIDIGRDPYAPNTLPGVISELRELARWANAYGLPAEIGSWSSEDSPAHFRPRPRTDRHLHQDTAHALIVARSTALGAGSRCLDRSATLPRFWDSLTSSSGR
jgi:hypothetical protein